MTIISGGQTGADRAALDFALEHGFEIGGWVPAGRQAEDGPVPERYPNLRETEGGDPAERTHRNVRDADATLVVSHGPPRGGSQRTLDEAHRLNKPALHLDVRVLDVRSAQGELRAWIETVQPRMLNVAGPRASEDAGIYEAVKLVLDALLLTTS